MVVQSEMDFVIGKCNSDDGTLKCKICNPEANTWKKWQRQGMRTVTRKTNLNLQKQRLGINELGQ